MSDLTTVWTPYTLPVDDNVPGNTYAFSIDLTQPWFLSKGAMIAYYGQMSFRSLQHGLEQHLLHMVAQRFSAPLYLGDFFGYRCRWRAERDKAEVSRAPRRRRKCGEIGRRRHGRVLGAEDVST